jgi:penicillin-binding protein 1A
VVPEGVTQTNGDYHYVENPPGVGVYSLGLGDKAPSEAEKSRDEVKNELF